VLASDNHLVRLRGRSLPLLLRFTVLSTVVVAVLGVALSAVMTSQIAGRAHASAEEKARVVAVAGIEPYLSHDDLQGLGPAGLDRIDTLLESQHLHAAGVRRIKVFSEDARLVYSDSRRQIGSSAADSPTVRTALTGLIASKIVDGLDHNGQGERMLEVYVPLVASARSEERHTANHVAGVLEVYLPYAPVAEAISADRGRLHLALGVGLLLLWAALFRIVQGASKRLRRQAEENRRLALHDGLTGLPNRALLYDRLGSAYARAERDGTPFTMILLDLDGFKEVNDSLGHHAGDELLREVGDRLSGLVRRTDTVARLGGDEFAFVLADTPAEECGGFVDRLRGTLRPPFSAAGVEVLIGASVGIAASGTASMPDELVRNADLGMYEAKDGDQDAVAFEPGMYARAVERRALEGDLRRALDEEEFELHYQPIVSVADGRVHGFEALIRWSHPQRGIVAPGEFIPVAERSGLIGEIGNWVLDEACRQLGQWRREGIVDPGVAVSVNVSARQLRDDALASRLLRALARHDVPAENLIMEITESVLTEEDRTAAEHLHALRRRGVRVALDDFGTGYSSLSRLTSLPVDHLKIDRSFINKMQTVAGGYPLAASIIAMGRSLDLTVVAEGVETTEQLTALRRLNCDLVQGYLLSRPVPAGAVAELLERAFPFDGLTTTATATTNEIEDKLAALVESLVTGGQDPDDLIRAVLRELLTLTGLESTYLTVIDWERNEQEVLHAINSGTLDIFEGLTAPWEETLCRLALEDRRRHTSDVSGTYPDNRAGAELGLGSFACFPVCTPAGAVLGTLSGASADAIDVPDNVLTLMELFARFLGERLDLAAGSPQRALAPQAS
jgi:diguanylate cyclase (GGDEF)-like protein